MKEPLAPRGEAKVPPGRWVVHVGGDTRVTIEKSTGEVGLVTM